MDSGQRENCRYKADHYKHLHAQWMAPEGQLKESMKIMVVMAERDKALQERNIALAEKKAALAERDMAILQRDAAIAERSNAIRKRDNALSELRFAHENSSNSGQHQLICPSVSHGTQNSHQHRQSQQHLQHFHHQQQQLSNAQYNSRAIQASDVFAISTAPNGIIKSHNTKGPMNETSVQDSPSKKPAKSPMKRKKNAIKDPNKQVTIARSAADWRGEFIGEDLNKQAPQVKKHKDWKDQDRGLNQAPFDDSTMSVPVCSCTGEHHQCYKWENGGWQSACCTKTMSMYPLPVMPNKTHGRLSGRKMSGSAFRKLLSRLSADGYDLSLPVDLKDHWAKHGTNKYITIK